MATEPPKGHNGPEIPEIPENPAGDQGFIARLAQRSTGLELPLTPAPGQEKSPWNMAGMGHSWLPQR